MYIHNMRLFNVIGMCGCSLGFYYHIPIRVDIHTIVEYSSEENVIFLGSVDTLLILYMYSTYTTYYEVGIVPTYKLIICMCL